MVEIYNNIIFIIKLLIAEKTFKTTSNYDLEDNSKTFTTDLF